MMNNMCSALYMQELYRSMLCSSASAYRTVLFSADERSYSFPNSQKV